MKDPRRTIWLVRHGQRLDNIDPLWKSQAKRWDDPPLSIRGHVQAREVGKRLAAESIDYAICSPFTRCVQTITGIFEDKPKKVPIFIEPGLGESLNACNNPPGRPSIEEICEINSHVDTSYRPVFTDLPPENGQDEGCSLRIEITLKRLIEKYPTGNLLLVSHGSPIAACHLALIGHWSYVGQCTIGKIVEENGAFHCEYYGSKDHLSDKTDLRDVQAPKRALLPQTLNTRY